MLSHQLQRNQIDGEKQIIQNAGDKQKQEMEKVEIDKHEVYAIDILFSTGKGQLISKILFYYNLSIRYS